MSKTQIIYNPQMQPSSRKEIEKYVDKYVWLLPKWCHKLNVGLWDSHPDGFIATMQTDYTYRFCVLDLYSVWIDKPDYIKEETIIHEFLHCHLSILADYARNTINNLCSVDDAPKFHNHLQSQLQMFHEQITEDLSLAIFTKTNERKNSK